MRHLLAAALLFAAACKPSAPAEGPASALSGPKLGGGEASLAALKGKVVLVDFWATWCDPCREEIPELARLQNKLAGKGFTVLGVSMDEDLKGVAPFAKKMGINYPVILLGTERAPKGWVVPGLPTAYLVGRDGVPLKRYFGSKSVESLTADVEAALAR